MKKITGKKQSALLTALISSLMICGCSSNSTSVNQNSNPSETENELTVSEKITENTTESQSGFSEEAHTGNEIKHSDKTVEERLNLISSTDFYGFNTDEPYRAKGSGPEKPENYFPPDYYFFCENVSITDPVLLKMINDFIEESRISITADYERYAAFYGLDFEIDDIMTSSCEISIINNYCFVSYEYIFISFSDQPVEYRKEFLNKIKNTNLISESKPFSLRCAYFDITEHRRLELSDLFFKDYNFAAEINKDVYHKFDHTGSCKKFSGLNQEFMNIYPYYGSSWYIKSPVLCPYPDFSCYLFNDNRELYFNSCIYSDPVKFDSSVFTGKTDIIETSSYTYVRYGADTNYPGMIRCPVESDFIDNETIQSIKKISFDELGDLIYAVPYGDDRVDENQIRCALCIEYLNDFDIFYVYINHNIEACNLLFDRRYYDAKTLKKLSMNELLTVTVGENWRDYFESDTENISSNELYIYTERTDNDKCIRHFSILSNNIEEKIEFILKDGKWIPDTTNNKKEEKNK